MNNLNTTNPIANNKIDNAAQFINTLYQAVDNKDINYLNAILSERVNFRIGNFTTLTDRESALDANRDFFASINSMSHTIDKMCSKGNDLWCSGSVAYIRLDGSSHNCYFATQLTVIDDKITDYYVYADLSAL